MHKALPTHNLGELHSPPDRIERTPHVAIVALVLASIVAPALSSCASSSAPPRTSPGGDSLERSRSEEQARAEPLDRETAEYRSRAEAQLTRIPDLVRAVVNAPSPRTEENTLRPYHQIFQLLDEVSGRAWAFAQLHPRESMRSAALQIGLATDRIATDLSLERGLYDALRGLSSLEIGQDARRYVRLELRDFRRAGVDRDAPTRARIRELSDQISSLSHRFGRNVDNDDRSVSVRATALDGLPADYTRRFSTKANGSVEVTTRDADAVPLLAYSRDAEARRSVWMAYRSRGYPENLEILPQLVAARHELATLLGYPNWAAFSAETRMVQKASQIGNFLKRVREISESRARAEYAQLVAAKQKDPPAAEQIEPWEVAYYTHRVKAEEFAFDPREVRPYFELGRVKKGILDLCAELFQIRFAPAPDVKVWADGVEAYVAFDTRDSNERELGLFYLDLHPRPGKYVHTAMFPLRAGVAGETRPEAVLVSHLPHPDRPPALLTFREVRTLFHEFGHVLAHLFAGKNRWVRLSRGVVEHDFVQAPSQMLEEWMNDPKILARFARHYQTDEPIPAPLVDRMVRAESFGRGLETQRQALLAEYSLELHRAGATVDPMKSWRAVHDRYSFHTHAEGSYFPASFRHLTGFSSNYYTYLWSRVIARDLLSAFRRRDGVLELTDGKAALRYREQILEPGGARPAKDLVKRFLGRPFSMQSYQRWLTESTR